MKRFFRSQKNARMSVTGHTNVTADYHQTNRKTDTGKLQSGVYGHYLHHHHQQENNVVNLFEEVRLQNDLR